MKNDAIPVYRSGDRPGFAEMGLLYTFVTDREFSANEHSHDFYEILFLFSGAVDHKVNGTVYSMHSGDVYLLCPGSAHLPIRRSSALRACMFSVLPEVIAPMLNAYGISRLCREHTDGFLLNMPAQQQEAIFYALRQLPFIRTEQKMEEVQIILGMICQAVLFKQRENRLAWLDHLQAAVNTPEKLSKGVSSLQDAANLSHAQLCRVFEKQLGQTPQQFLIALRMSYAYDAICSTSEPFEQIAASIGYMSYSHFCRLFKSIYGVTPSALRKSTRKYW